MKFICFVLFTGLLSGTTRAETAEKDSYQLIKEMVRKMRPIILSVLDEMPSTFAYHKYQQDWKAVLRIYHEHKDNEKCLRKLNRIVTAYDKLITSYMNANATAEEKELLKLFLKHGFQKFTEKYSKLMHTAKDPDYDILESC
ncbi:uncharacterized protein isoform X2 [Musca autumnalis]|uniref:uncharacterized protein isoform X2 n=1 Tax=Musca autumnalis TaxID=221902 RepID=UPI003CF37548